MLNIDIVKLFFPCICSMSFYIYIYIYWDGLINLFLLGKNQPQHPETTGICPPITIAILKGKIMVNQRTFGYPMSNKLYKLDFARRCLKKTQLQWYNVDKNNNKPAPSHHHFIGGINHSQSWVANMTLF